MPEDSLNRRTQNGEAAPPSPPLSELEPEFVAMLRCPACADRPELTLSDARDALICRECGRIYPIRDGFPDLVPEDAELPGDNNTITPSVPKGDQ